MMKTKFTYSRVVKAITAFCLVSLVLALVGVIFLYEGSPLIEALLIALLSVIIIVPVYYAPRYYELRVEGLYIRRLGFGRLYSYMDYEITEEQGDIPLYALRLWGSGGYWGFWGKFYSGTRGTFDLIATRRSGAYYQLRHRRSGRVVIVGK